MEIYGRRLFVNGFAVVVVVVAVVVVVVVELCDLPVVDPADFVTGDLSWLSGLPGQLT